MRRPIASRFIRPPSTLEDAFRGIPQPRRLLQFPVTSSLVDRDVTYLLGTNRTVYTRDDVSETPPTPHLFIYTNAPTRIIGSSTICWLFDVRHANETIANKRAAETCERWYRRRQSNYTFRIYPIRSVWIGCLCLVSGNFVLEPTGGVSWSMAGWTFGRMDALIRTGWRNVMWDIPLGCLVVFFSGESNLSILYICGFDVENIIYIYFMMGKILPTENCGGVSGA